MDRNKVLETTYMVIRDSLEWGMEYDSKEYYHFIDGVMAMTDKLLGDPKQIDEKN